MKKIVDIVAGVASGSITASKIIEEHLSRIKAREDEIHAFNLVTDDQARADAEKIDADINAGKKPGALLVCPSHERQHVHSRG